MHTFILWAAAFSGLVAAQSTTSVPYLGVPFSITGVGPTSTAASVVSINAVVTTYEISCLDGVPSTLCDIDKPWTLVQGDTTFSFTGVYTVPYSSGTTTGAITGTLSEQCSFTHTSESVSCTMSYSASGSAGALTYSTSTSATSSFPPDSITYYGLPVTGGLKSFTAPQATQTPGAAAAAGPAKALITAAPLAVAALAAVL